MDLRTYDTAFVEKIGAVPTPGSGYRVQIGGSAVPVFFDLPEEWWEQKYQLPGIIVRRLDMIPDPRRFMPGYRVYEQSSTPGMLNKNAQIPTPITLLYSVELAAGTQAEMNALLAHNLKALPPMGFGTTINAFGHSMPFRANSLRNRTEAKEGRKFVWEYTYAVDAWIISLECVKVPQIMQIDVEVQGGDGVVQNITVGESNA